MTLLSLRLLLAVALLVPAAAPAQSPSPGPPQLDRIERGIEEILRRLEALEAGRAGRAPVAAAPASPPDYRPGAVAVLRPAPASDALLAPPADSLATSVYAGGPLRLYAQGPGGRPGEQVGVELQGWLRAREAGRHQIFVDFSFARANGFGYAPCAAVLWVEERRAGQASGELASGLGRNSGLSLTLGADLAAPGLYRFRLWLSCARSPSAASPITADVSLKAPADASPRGLVGDDVLHRQG